MEKNEEQVDEGLRGNEKIEMAILALQQEPTGEMLAHTLTVVRRRMRESGQLILALDAPAGDAMQVQAIQTKDGQRWWVAFTGFEEELKGSGSVMSTFLTDIEQLLRKALQEDGISGVILNPWQRTLMLDKTLIQIILGEEPQ
ncbi:MAG: SseB family protein [Lachnospiraceae bacterium]|nr:SseB family protein [Lachnospiraceae bacterium]